MGTFAPFFDLGREMKNAYNHRLRLVESAKQRGIKPTARLFATTVPTVRKWLRRHQQHGPSGLVALSRARYQQSQKTPPAIEAQLVELRKTLPTFGARRLIREFDLPISHRALDRIWREHGLLKKRRKKYQRKQATAASSSVTPRQPWATASTCASPRPRTLTRATSKPCIASKKTSSSIWKISPAAEIFSPKCTPTSCTSTSPAPTRTKKTRAPGRSSSGSLPARRSNSACFHLSSWIITSTTQGDTMWVGFPIAGAHVLHRNLVGLKLNLIAFGF